MYIVHCMYKNFQMRGTWLPGPPLHIQSPFVRQPTVCANRFVPFEPSHDAVHIVSFTTQCTLPPFNVGADIGSLAPDSTHQNVLGRFKVPLIDGAVRLLDLFQIADFNQLNSFVSFPNDYTTGHTWKSCEWFLLKRLLLSFSITIHVNYWLWSCYQAYRLLPKCFLCFAFDVWYSYLKAKLLPKISIIGR